MQNDTNPIRETWTQCKVCSLLNADKVQELDKLIVTLCKCHGLPVIVQSATVFVKMLIERDLERHEKQPPRCATEDMLKHIHYCVASHESSVRMYLCNYEILQLLDNATQEKKIPVINVLLKTATQQNNNSS